MKRRLPSANTWALLGILAATVVLRAYLPHDRVFTPTHVNFQGDAWYHMRAIEHLVANYPHRLSADPYALPEGQYVPIAPLFDYLVATLALVAGGGTPSPALVERVAAYAPVLMAAVTVVFAYLFGRMAFGTSAGLLGAALLAVMPGHFLGRTLLGASDHHGAEAALAMAVFFFLARAVAAPDRGSGRWWLKSGLAGISLGAYMLTWTSGAFLVAILAAWAVVHAGINLGHGRSLRHGLREVAPVFLVALVMVVAVQDPAMPRCQLQIGSLVGALLILVGIEATDWAARAHRWRPRLVRFGLLALVALLTLATLPRGVPSLVAEAMTDLSRFFPGDPTNWSVLEMRPLLLGPDGVWSWNGPGRSSARASMLA